MRVEVVKEGYDVDVNIRVGFRSSGGVFEQRCDMIEVIFYFLGLRVLFFGVLVSF